MIIIGKTEKGFIVEVSEEDLTRIMGYGYKHEVPVHARPKVGWEVKVCDLWNALYHARDRRKEIDNLATGLRRAADNVDAINAALAHPMVEVKS